MKNFIPTTLIALFVSITGFSQTQKEPVRNISAAASTNNRLMLLSPADGKLFNGSEGAKTILFRWTAMEPKTKEAIIYRLKVWQLMQGQNGMEAMRINQPIITKDVANITQAAISNIYTGPCKPPYLCDFIWAVEVINNEGFSIGNSQTGNAVYSFKFEVNNPDAEKAEANNKGNAVNNGMSTGKSQHAQGDPVHGVDVKLGTKPANKQ